VSCASAVLGIVLRHERMDGKGRGWKCCASGAIGDAVC
jgi:hypothetical protein